VPRVSLPRAGLPAMSGRRWAAGASVLGALLVTALVWRVAAADGACAATTKAGRATFYDLAGDVGNCNFKPPADDLYVALGPAQYDGAAACGQYYDVTGPRGTVRVKVFDQCPECEPGHLDLSRTAFSKIGTTSNGLIDVRYRRVPDPAGHGKLQVRVVKGSSQYWVALVVENAGNGLRKVEIRSGGGSFKSAVQEDFNYWTVESGAGKGPFDVRVTDDRGHRVTATGVDLAPEKLQTTSARLYGSGSGASTVTEAKPEASGTKAAKAKKPRATPAATASAPAASATAGAGAAPGPAAASTLDPALTAAASATC
jgi:expansin (peptidoglycan-binding protein)